MLPQRFGQPVRTNQKSFSIKVDPDQAGQSACCSDSRQRGGGRQQTAPCQVAENADLCCGYPQIEKQHLAHLQVRERKVAAKFPEEDEWRHGRQGPYSGLKNRLFALSVDDPGNQKHDDRRNHRQQAAERQGIARVLGRRSRRAMALYRIRRGNESVLEILKCDDQRRRERIDAELTWNGESADRDRDKEACAADHRLIDQRQRARCEESSCQGLEMYFACTSEVDGRGRSKSRSHKRRICPVAPSSFSD